LLGLDQAGIGLMPAFAVSSLPSFTSAFSGSPAGRRVAKVETTPTGRATAETTRLPVLISLL
jgi:hypothetical protein